MAMGDCSCQKHQCQVKLRPPQVPSRAAAALARQRSVRWRLLPRGCSPIPRNGSSLCEVPQRCCEQLRQYAVSSAEYFRWTVPNRTEWPLILSTHREATSETALDQGNAQSSSIAIQENRRDHAGEACADRNWRRAYGTLSHAGNIGRDAGLLDLPRSWSTLGAHSSRRSFVLLTWRHDNCPPRRPSRCGNQHRTLSRLASRTRNGRMSGMVPLGGIVGRAAK
jgi:hypothetical protein